MAETQDLGTARVNIVADTSDAVAGIEAVKRSVAGMAQDGKRNLRDLATAERERATGLGQYITAIRTGNVRQLAMNEALRFGRIALVGLGAGATTAIAGVAALGLAWEAHNQRLHDANNALILTGNQARTSAAEMHDIASEMDRMRGVTTGTAMAALSEVAATGRFTVEEMEMVARAAEHWRVATGTAVNDTVEIFKKIADDPIKALLKLHETQNFLTKEQLAYLDTLKEQGREQELVTAGIRMYSDVAAERAPQIAANVTRIANAWNMTRNAASKALDEFVNASGRMMDWLQRNTIEAGARSPIGHAMWQLFRGGSPAPAALPGDDLVERKEGANREAAEKALREFESLALSNLSKRERLEADIAKIRERGLAAGQKQAAIDKAVADARARYAEAEARSNRGRTRTTVDPADTLINRLRQQIALNQEQLQQEDGLTTSQRLRVQVEQELERIGGKMVASKRALIDALVAELTTTGDLVKAHQQELKNKEALARQEAILAAQADNRRAANQADLLSIGHGAEQVERVRRLIDIQREYTEELKRLGDRSVADDKAAWDLMAENARRHRDQQLQEEGEFQRKRAELMADWRQGRDRAIADYVSEANDIAGQAYAMLNSGLGELEQRIVGVTTTGKFEWRSMLDAWVADLTRFATRQVFADLLKKFFPGAGGQDQA